MERIIPTEPPYEVHFRVQLAERVQSEAQRDLDEAVRAKAAKMALCKVKDVEVLEGGFDGITLTGRAVFPTAYAAERAVAVGSPGENLTVMVQGNPVAGILSIANPEIYTEVRAASLTILKLQNLDECVTPAALFDTFYRFGSITDIIIQTKQTKKGRNVLLGAIGFVSEDSIQPALNATSSANSSSLHDPCSLTISRPPTNTPAWQERLDEAGFEAVLKAAFPKAKEWIVPEFRQRGVGIVRYGTSDEADADAGDRVLPTLGDARIDPTSLVRPGNVLKVTTQLRNSTAVKQEDAPPPPQPNPASMLPPPNPTKPQALIQPTQVPSQSNQSQPAPLAPTYYNPPSLQPQASTSSSHRPPPQSISPQFGHPPQSPSTSTSHLSSVYDPRRDRSTSSSARAPTSTPLSPGTTLPHASGSKSGKQKAAGPTWKSTLVPYPHPKAVGRPRRDGEPVIQKNYLMVDLPREDLKRSANFTLAYCGTDWPDLDSGTFTKAEVSSSAARERRFKEETARYKEYFPKVKLEQARQLQLRWSKADLPTAGQELSDADQEAMESSLVGMAAGLHRQWSNENALVKLYRVREVSPIYPTQAQQALAISSNRQSGIGFLDLCCLGTEKSIPPPNHHQHQHQQRLAVPPLSNASSSPQLPPTALGGGGGGEGEGAQAGPGPSSIQNQQRPPLQPQVPAVPRPLPETFVDFLVHWPPSQEKERLLEFLAISAAETDPYHVRDTAQFKQLFDMYERIGYLQRFFDWHEKDEGYMRWLSVRQAKPEAVLNQGQPLINRGGGIGHTIINRSA